MNIRRLTRADAKKVATWLKKTYEDDVLSGGDPSVPSADSIELWADRGATWVCIESHKLIGLLHAVGQGTMLAGDKTFTFTLFNLLAVDYALYTTSKQQAIEVASQLTIGAADDIRDHDRMTDLIRVIGPKDSRGASWSRLLGMSEITHKGSYGEWLLPFKLIWERVEAVSG